MINREHGWNQSFKPLLLGATLSLLLTLSAYFIMTRHHLSESLLVWTLLGLCMTQVLAQLWFFLHVGMESKPHWNTVTFLFMVLVLVIVIGGSIWIMQNLKYNVM